MFGELSQDYLEEVAFICEQAQCSDRTSEWEKDFCSSISQNIGRWGKRTIISARQRTMLDKILLKLKG